MANQQAKPTDLNHYIERLDTLNDLNRLVVASLDVKKLSKCLAREALYHFKAEVAVIMLLDANELKIEGLAGCLAESTEQSITLDGIPAQAIKIGGHISVNNPASIKELPFLAGCNNLNLCCLESNNTSLGLIVIGSAKELSNDDIIRFEEFAAGAAVAIANSLAQQRLNNYAENLEQLVEERTKELAIETKKAEDANLAKSRFLANMSHELRTPLTAIIGYSSVMQDGIYGELTPKQKECIATIAKSGEHLKRLINDVLNLARVESGREEAKSEALVLADVLNQSFKLMQQQALSKNVELKAPVLDDDLSKIKFSCDPKHASQILFNLFSNAIKYTPSGGHVWVECKTQADKIAISICDSGVGIEPSKIEDLFKRFERGEDTYSREQEGTGIGLNLTRHLIELNGGRIHVESKVGEGSKFTVFLPLESGETKEAAKQINENETVRLDGITTLIVDDNRVNCELLQQILQHAGAKATYVNDVPAAITKLESEEMPDILLTDLAIPKISGLNLIEHIRNTAKSKIPIIVLSACAFEKDKEAALNAGASAFIAKPFNNSEVIKVVHDLTMTR